MEYLSDKEKLIKTPLKFDCPRCRGPVVSNYLHIGEELNCPHCGETIAVPESAVVTSEDSNVLEIWRTEKVAQIPQRKPTKAERIKSKYKKIHIVIVVIVTVILDSALEKIITDHIFRPLISFVIAFLVTYTIATFEQQEKDSTPKSELDKEAE